MTIGLHMQLSTTYGRLQILSRITGVLRILYQTTRAIDRFLSSAA